MVLTIQSIPPSITWATFFLEIVRLLKRKPVWVNMKSLRKWLDNNIAKLNCFVNKHGPFKVLYVYETRTVTRYFQDSALHKIRVLDQPIEITYELQKRKCLKCGRVSMDLVAVSDQDAWQ
jgi:hypothetical protein